MREHGPPVYPKAVDTAPFATETSTGSSLAADGDIGDVTSEEGRKELIASRYRTSLEGMRKQAGIIAKPSSQLQGAEKALAQVKWYKAEMQRWPWGLDWNHNPMVVSEQVAIDLE